MEETKKTRTANMKRIQATMVEYIDDTNEFAWYDVFMGVTPRQALKLYAKEHDLEQVVIERILNGIDGYRINDHEARAYYITIGDNR